MRRRRFIEMCAGGVAATLLGCLPDETDGTGRGDGVRLLGDGGDRPADPDAGGVTGTDAGARGPDAGAPPPPGRDAGPDRRPAPDAGSGVDRDRDAGPGSCDDTVLMHDMHAQSLYFDGSYGPLTGIIRVDWVVAGDAVELEFWHGHGGRNHRFTVLPEHFEALARGERVTIETTAVDSHTHQLFIDPVDERWRVDGAEDVPVPLC